MKTENEASNSCYKPEVDRTKKLTGKGGCNKKLSRHGAKIRYKISCYLMLFITNKKLGENSETKACNQITFCLCVFSLIDCENDKFVLIYVRGRERNSHIFRVSLIKIRIPRISIKISLYVSLLSSKRTINYQRLRYATYMYTQYSRDMLRNIQ